MSDSTAPVAPNRSTLQTSLRRRVFLAVVSVGIVPAALALLISYFAAYRSITNMVRDQGIDSATMLAQDFDARLASYAERFREAIGAGGIAAAVSRLEAPQPQDDDAVRELYLPIATAIGETPMYVLDGQGAVTAHVLKGMLLSGNPAAPLPSTLEYRDVLNRLRDAAPEHALALIEHRRADGGLELWLLGRLLNTPDSAPLFATILLPLERTIQMVETPPGSAERRTLILVSRRNGLVHAPSGEAGLSAMLERHPARLFTERTGTVDNPEVEGFEFAFARVITAAALSGGSPNPVEWAVIQRLNVGDTLANLRHALWGIAVGALVLLVLIGAFGFYAAERVVRPILELTSGVERLANGELDHRVEVNTGDELEVLAGSMNQMAATLAESYRRLAMKLLELDEKARQLALVHQISKSINRSLDLEQLFRMFTNEVRDLVHIERMSLGLVTESGREIELIHVFPPSRIILPRGSRFSVNGSHMGECVQSGSSKVHTLVGRRSTMEEDRMLDGTGMARLCIVPLNTAKGTIGVLALSDSDPNRFVDEEEVEVISLMADSLALAVEHSRLYAQAKNFAAELELKVEERTRDLKSAQNLLLTAERFAATGKIATDLAHEINNPLSIIKNYLAIVSSHLLRPATSSVDTETTRDGIRVIEEEIDRIARIVSQLRQLHAPQSPQLKVIVINDEIRALAELFRATFTKSSLALHLKLDPKLTTVRVCSDHLRQILVNLLTNAADATDAGGSITISTQWCEEPPNHFAVLVTDTGTGISDENVPKIFDPFFTTKREGKGTGLGLSVSYSLATRMGGSLVCESKVGAGTTMKIIIPQNPDGEPVAPPTDASDVEELRKSGGKIFLG